MSTTEIRIAIDCMGGDAGLPVTVPAAHQFAKQNPDTRFLLAGDPAAIETRLVSLGSLGRDWYEILPASAVVAMDDSVEVALRRKIGRASCRESVCQYVSISVVAVSLQNKTSST